MNKQIWIGVSYWDDSIAQRNYTILRAHAYKRRGSRYYVRYNMPFYGKILHWIDRSDIIDMRVR